MTARGDAALAWRSVPAATRPLRVALLGLGTVGQSVLRILAERPELADRIQLTHVFNRDIARKRSAADVARTLAPDPTQDLALDVARHVARDNAPDVARDFSPAISATSATPLVWTDRIDDVFAARPDVVIEAIGGLSPAEDWVRRALVQRASVVTANKLLMATSGADLLRVAAVHGAELRFEAAVAGGVPLIHAVRHGLAGDVLTRVKGILNGTSNFVLSRMASSGLSLEDALGEATRLGYAEADPSADIDGPDAAAKLVVLAGVAFGRQLRLSSVAASSIRHVESVDFRYASRLGLTIRQVSVVERGADDRIHASVGPALVPASSPLGLNDGANNVIAVTGRYGGTTVYSGAGAGGEATAVAVLSDVLALGGPREARSAASWASARTGEAPQRSFYVRFVVHDRPGILAAITGALARHAINVDAVLQEPGYSKERLPFVVTVEPCLETTLRLALRDAAAGSLHATPLVLPLES